MNLSNVPTWVLVEDIADMLGYWGKCKETCLIDNELESRIPNGETYHFGDCAGQSVFVPIEPEYDDNGNPILEKMIGYDDNGNEIWN